MSKKSFLITRDPAPGWDELSIMVNWLYENLNDRYEVGAGIINFHNEEDATLFCLKFKGKINFREIIKHD